MREELVHMDAYGFFSKVDELDELLAGLRDVAAGRESASSSVSRQSEEERARSQLRQKGLSKRQMAVLDLLAKGRCVKEIAEAMHIAEATVAVHKRRAFQKLGARNAVEAAGRLLAPWRAGGACVIESDDLHRT